MENTAESATFFSLKGKTMHLVHGGCHCGNISYVAEFPNAPFTYTPRACDCKLCTSHGAAYSADKDGSLVIHIKDRNNVSKYRQGSRIAEFVVCKICGVMIGVCFEEGSVIYGAINIRSSVNFSEFGECRSAHLTQLTDEDRIARWKKSWFPNVRIEYDLT